MAVYLQIATGQTELTYHDTTAGAGVHYFYRVSGYNETAGEGDKSSYDEGYAMPRPGAPGGVQATDKENARPTC